MAVDVTLSVVQTAIRANNDPAETQEVTRLLSLASSWVNDYAPNAPSWIQNEAAIQLIGYLYDRPSASKGLGYANALRNSGAAALLAPYRTIRAGAAVDAGGEQETSANLAAFTQRLRSVEQSLTQLSALIDSVQALPPFPTAGERNDKVPKFDGDDLGWEPDAEGAGGQGVALTDDAVLDLVKTSRTAGDRGSLLGVSVTDENQMAFLSVDVPLKASNTDVDGETDDSDYMTVAKTFRAIARKVKTASTTVLGLVRIARNEDVDSTETDTSRVLDVAKAKRLIARVAPGGQGGSFTPSKANLFTALKAVFVHNGNDGVTADDANNEIDIAIPPDSRLLPAPTVGNKGKFAAIKNDGTAWEVVDAPAGGGGVNQVTGDDLAGSITTTWTTFYTGKLVDFLSGYIQHNNDFDLYAFPGIKLEFVPTSTNGWKLYAPNSSIQIRRTGSGDTRHVQLRTTSSSDDFYASIHKIGEDNN